MKKRNGLLALLGIGALAFWKYKKMSPEEKEKVKNQFNDAKRKFSEAGEELKTKVEEKFESAKEIVDKKVEDFKIKNPN